MYKLIIKRFIDFFIALGMLVILSPIFLLVFVLLVFVNKGKAFFFQKRPGKNERIFKIIKFKSMNDKKDEDGNLLPDEMRISAIGNLVRKTSLDEIPQLLNVLKGDMSLIGPRPLLVEYLKLYSTEQKKRHLIKPGITGWAQVNGRNTISWEQKFKYDVWYVENYSFILDVKIFWKSIMKVLRRDDISSNTHVTMEAFTGK